MTTISDINIIPLKGYNKAELLDGLEQFKPNVVPGCNSTFNWIKAGKPLYGTNAFKQFCVEELIKKTKLTPGLGCYIEIEKGCKDKKNRPFKLIKPKNATGIKKYILRYVISEVVINKANPKNDETDVLAIKQPITSFTTLGEAKEAVKDLTSETKKDFIIQSIKIPDDSIKIICKYNASKNAKEGTYIVFGINFKNEETKEYTLCDKES